MKNILISLVSILTFTQAAEAIVCTATAETFDSNNKFVSVTQKLELDSEDVGAIRYKAELGEGYYFVQNNKSDNTFLLMITLGPEYTQGVTASMTWDLTNRMRISRVDGYKVYKLSCENE